MSTITVTNLVPGEAATSTDANLNLTTWNTGTAAGSIGSSNVQFEGIDRRTMDDDGNVVEMETSDYFEDSSSGAVANTTGTPVVVSLNGGTEDMQVGPITAPTSARLLLHASVMVEKDVVAPGPLPLVTLTLEQSPDAVTWTYITGSERKLRMRSTGTLCNAGSGIPGIKQTVSWAQYVATTGSARYYRVAYETANGSFEFMIGSIIPEVLLR